MSNKCKMRYTNFSTDKTFAAIVLCVVSFIYVNCNVPKRSGMKAKQMAPLKGSRTSVKMVISIKLRIQIVNFNAI